MKTPIKRVKLKKRYKKFIDVSLDTVLFVLEEQHKHYIVLWPTEWGAFNLTIPKSFCEDLLV